MEQSLPLREIHLPDPIGWWPLAPGWWLLIIGIPLLLLLLAWLWRFLRRKTVKKLALLELETIARNDLPPLEKVQKLAILLRRISLSAYPRAEVAGLTGEAWLEFLDHSFKTRPFSEGSGRLLIEAPYRREFEGDLETLVALCRDWIKRLPKGQRPDRSASPAKRAPQDSK